MPVPWLELLLVLLLSGQVIAQVATRPPAPAQPTPSSPEARRQAFLRFIEAQRLKAEAQSQRSTRLVDQAIRAFKDAIRLDPAAAEPHIDLGEIYFFYLSQRDLAEQEAREAIRLEPGNVGGHLLLARLALSLTREENKSRAEIVAGAIRAYEKVAEIDPRLAEAWAFLAELYQQTDQPEKQMAALEKWIAAPLPSDEMFYRWMTSAELAPDQAYYQLSALYLRQGKNDQALAAARKAYEAAPESEAYGSNLITVLSTLGSNESELKVYEQLMKSASSPMIMLGYGGALVRSGRYEEAIALLREYAGLDPANTRSSGLLAIAQRRSNQRAAAVETLKAALSAGDNESRRDLQLELAETYEEMGLNQEAIAQYEKLFDGFLSKGPLTPVNSPLFNEVVNRLVRVLRRVGNQQKMQSVLTRTRRVVDEHNPLLDLLAIDSLREEGKRREALTLVRTAGRRNPDDRMLIYTEAMILAEMKRFSESLELLEGLIRGVPESSGDDAVVYTIMSSVHQQNQDFKQAEATARQALELVPGDPGTLLQLAGILERKGDLDAAEKILRDLLARDPGNANALNNLGYFLLERGSRVEEAYRLIEKAVTIEPVNGNFLDSLGWAAFKLGKLEEARVTLEKALVYSRRSATIHEHLGDLFFKLDKLAEARKNWEKALEYSVEADETARLKVKLNKK